MDCIHKRVWFTAGRSLSQFYVHYYCLPKYSVGGQYCFAVCHLSSSVVCRGLLHFTVGLQAAFGSTG